MLSQSMEYHAQGWMLLVMMLDLERSQQDQAHKSESFVRIEALMNYEIRKFQDDLVDLINATDIPVEAKLIVLELITANVQKVADNAIIAEMSDKEAQDAKSIPEDKLGELSE